MADESLASPRATAILRSPTASGFRLRVPAARFVEEPRWREDLRLFAMTFAGGFVFFLTLIG